MHTTRRITRCFVLFTVLMTLSDTSAKAGDDPNAPSEKENELLAVLRSDAPAAEKAITCKLLAIHGSSEAVGDLAKLLSDEQLSSWARIALEAIPGAAADEALRKATDSLQGRLLIGAINSIGVRRDAEAVDSLTSHLGGNDSEVASAAAVALGRIGNAPATAVLREALAVAPAEVRSAVAEGCVLCAERLYSQGMLAEATQIYDAVRTADVPQQRVIEATRGAILARSEAGIPLLLEQFRSPDKKMFQLALGTAREFPGRTVDQALVDEMNRAQPERAALMIQAMADRPETVVLTAVLTVAGQGPKQVRLSAIDALKRIGDVSCLSTLLGTALETDMELASSAKETLADLPGAKVDDRILTLLPQAEGGMYPLLIEVVGQRRLEAVPELMKALDHSDRDVRSAALIALGETIDLERLSVLVSRVLAPKHPGDAPVARQALKAASIRMPDPEACADLLAAAIDSSSSVPTKGSLLEIIAAVGGTKALGTVAAAAKSDSPQLQDVSTRLLGKWMTEDAAPVLLDLANTVPGEKYRVRSLRGYIRIARQFDLPIERRVEMCHKAFEAAIQTAERKLVLGVLKRYPNAETLKLAIAAMQNPDLKEDAFQATLTIAEKLGDHAGDVASLLSDAGFEKVKLQIVKAEYGAGSTQKDVTEALREQAGDLPVIVLASANYNSSLGGDPLPGTVKQLRVEYVINGKPGEASFEENTLIILPMPK